MTSLLRYNCIDCVLQVLESLTITVKLKRRSGNRLWSLKQWSHSRICIECLSRMQYPIHFLGPAFSLTRVCCNVWVPGMFMNLPLTPPSCRHTPEKKAQRPPLCLMPFGGGQRICIGRKIASVMYKMTVIEAPDTEVLSGKWEQYTSQEDNV